MYRVRLPNGHLTDMVNLSRAKDAAMSLAMDVLNGNAAAGQIEVPPMRLNLEAAEVMPQEP